MIQIGNNRQACFTYDEDIVTYVDWMAEGSVKYGVAIHG